MVKKTEGKEASKAHNFMHQMRHSLGKSESKEARVEVEDPGSLPCHSFECLKPTRETPSTCKYALS